MWLSLARWCPRLSHDLLHGPHQTIPLTSPRNRWPWCPWQRSLVAAGRRLGKPFLLHCLICPWVPGLTWPQESCISASLTYVRTSPAPLPVSPLQTWSCHHMEPQASTWHVLAGAAVAFWVCSNALGWEWGTRISLRTARRSDIQLYNHWWAKPYLR